MRTAPSARGALYPYDIRNPRMDTLTKSISALDIMHEIKIGDNGYTYNMAVGPEIAASRRKRNQLLKGLIDVGDSVVLMGAPSSFKSTLLASVLCTISAGGLEGTGLEYGGKDPIACVLVVGEDKKGACARIEGCQIVFNNGRPLENLAIISTGSAKLDTEEGKNAVIKMIESAEINPKVIAFDNLQRFIAGDENAFRDIGALIDNIEKIRAHFEATSILAQHVGKNSGRETTAMQRMRGSSRLYGCASDVLELQPLPDRSIKLIAQKVKNGASGQEYFFKPMQVTLPPAFDAEASDEPDTTVVLVPVAAQEVVQKPSRAVTDLMTLYQAWEAAEGDNAFTPDKREQLSKSRLKEFFRNSGRDQTWIDNALKLDKNRFLGRLLAAGFVRVDGDMISLTADGEAAVSEVKFSAPETS